MKLNEDTLTFLQTLYKDDDIIAIRTYRDKNKHLKGIDRIQNGQIRCNCCGEYFDEQNIKIRKKYNDAICLNCSVFMKTIPLKNLSRYSNRLFQKNKNESGVHIAVCGGHRDADCHKVYAHFFELDEGTFEEQAKIINKKCKNHPPTMIVQTKKSYHVYFKIQDGDISKFRDIQKRLAAFMGADPQKYNESTCMRLPGFYHSKKEPIMVKIVFYEPDNVYTQGDLDAWLPKLPEKELKLFNNNLGTIELTGVFKEDVLSMFYTHTRGYIKYERDDKIIMRCIVPGHEDKAPSAVMFKDTFYYYCKGCGASMSLYQLAKLKGWFDIEEAYKNMFKNALNEGKK